MKSSCLTLIVLAVGLAGSGCSDTLPRSQTGDLSRKLAPPPACIVRLPSRSAGAATTRTISDEQWWKVVFPSFDVDKRELPEHSTTCQGRDVFADAAFEGAAVRKPWPFKAEDGDLKSGAGVNKIRLLWFQTHTHPDGTVAGPLVLGRVLDDQVEVYSIGAYRGQPSRAKLKLERMGAELLPSVQSEGCLEHTEKTPCSTELQIFLPVRGKLQPVAAIPLERIAYAQASEPGAIGTVEYRMISTPTFEAGGIRLIEQVSALDEQGRDLRKAEVERVLRATSDGFEASEASLWERVVTASTEKKADAAKSPAKR